MPNSIGTAPDCFYSFSLLTHPRPMDLDIFLDRNKIATHALMGALSLRNFFEVTQKGVMIFCDLIRI